MKQKNKAFWALTRPQKRIAVAKDVIKQIKIKFFNPTRGTYFEIRNLGILPKIDKNLDKAFLQLKKEKANCRVCALGSCFVSLVNLGDKEKTRDFFEEHIYSGKEIDNDRMRPLLRKIFTPSQLTLIECAFEERDYMDDEKDLVNTPSKRIDAANFGKKYRNTTNRLIAIMKNIIKNKGIFIP